MSCCYSLAALSDIAPLLTVCMTSRSHGGLQSVARIIKDAQDSPEVASQQCFLNSHASDQYLAVQVSEPRATQDASGGPGGRRQSLRVSMYSQGLSTLDTEPQSQESKMERWGWTQTYKSVTPACVTSSWHCWQATVTLEVD